MDEESSGHNPGSELPGRPLQVWRRPLAYLLLAAGALLTFFSADIARLLGVGTGLAQFAALALLLAGAFLFYSVRERFNRTHTYRQAFRASSAPGADPPPPSTDPKTASPSPSDPD